MDTPLNLTPERGPSVWTEPRRSAMNWPLAAVAGGSLLAAYAWRSRSSSRTLLASVGVGAVACGLFAAGGSQRCADAWGRLRSARDGEFDDIDRASKDSFPASDPPAMK